MSLKSLDISKGPGSDNPPLIFIKECGNVMCECSGRSGTFPYRWKLAKVGPIFTHDIEAG